MERGQYTFYRSFYDALKSLPKKDREPVVMAICAYALDEELIPLSGTPAVVFSLIKPTLDAGRNKAANRLNKSETNEKQKRNKPKSNEEQNGKEKEKEKEGEEEKEKEKEREIENDSSISPHSPSSQKTPLMVAMDDFAKARKAMKKPLTDKARELTLKELEKLAPGDEATKVAIINQSIQRGWQGVFPLKEDEKKPKCFMPQKHETYTGDDTDAIYERLKGGTP